MTGASNAGQTSGPVGTTQGGQGGDAYVPLLPSTFPKNCEADLVCSSVIVSIRESTPSSVNLVTDNQLKPLRRVSSLYPLLCEIFRESNLLILRRRLPFSLRWYPHWIQEADWKGCPRQGSRVPLNTSSLFLLSQLYLSFDLPQSKCNTSLLVPHLPPVVAWLWT